MISVIIPTHNRCRLLEASLESLAVQTLPKDQFEVVVVDDGSTDGTRELCARVSARLSLRHITIAKSGTAAAKNLGIFLAACPLVLFFDDDDVAAPGLLAAHVRAHEQHAAQEVAVLGYTTWAAALAVSPVMEYVTEIGQFLFAYRNLRDGQVLDFTYFWAGRVSCKRSLLVRHAIFAQEFRAAAIEDIELGYRLSKHGLRVVFDRGAVSYMIRSITYDEFCRRCEKQGRALAQFARLHRHPAVWCYCEGQLCLGGLRGRSEIGNAAKVWEEIRPQLGPKVERVHELESELTSAARGNGRVGIELKALYQWTFVAFRLQGFVDAGGTGGSSRLTGGDCDETRRYEEVREQ